MGTFGTWRRASGLWKRRMNGRAVPKIKAVNGGSAPARGEDAMRARAPFPRRYLHYLPPALPIPVQGWRASRVAVLLAPIEPTR